MCVLVSRDLFINNMHIARVSQDVGASIPSDEYFVEMMKSCWKIKSAAAAADTVISDYGICFYYYYHSRILEHCLIKGVRRYIQLHFRARSMVKPLVHNFLSIFGILGRRYWKMGRSYHQESCPEDQDRSKTKPHTQENFWFFRRRREWNDHQRWVPKCLGAVGHSLKPQRTTRILHLFCRQRWQNLDQGVHRQNEPRRLKLYWNQKTLLNTIRVLSVTDVE